MFGPAFLGPSPTGASRATPKEDCLVVPGAAEGDCYPPSCPVSSDHMPDTA